MKKLLAFLLSVFLLGCQTAAPKDDAGSDDSLSCDNVMTDYVTSLRSQGYFLVSGLRTAATGHLYFVLAKAQGDDPVFLYVVAGPSDHDRFLLSYGFLLQFSCGFEGQPIYIYSKEMAGDDGDGA